MVEADVGPITPHSNLNLPPGQGGKSSERAELPQIPFKSSSLKNPSETLNTLIHSHLHMLSLTNHHLFKVCLLRPANERNVRSGQRRLACDSLLWVNGNYDNNDDVSVALLPPLMLFLGEQASRQQRAHGSCSEEKTKFSSANLNWK